MLILLNPKNIELEKTKWETEIYNRFGNVELVSSDELGYWLEADDDSGDLEYKYEVSHFHESLRRLLLQRITEFMPLFYYERDFIWKTDSEKSSKIDQLIAEFRKRIMNFKAANKCVYEALQPQLCELMAQLQKTKPAKTRQYEQSKSKEFKGFMINFKGLKGKEIAFLQDLFKWLVGKDLLKETDWEVFQAFFIGQYTGGEIKWKEGKVLEFWLFYDALFTQLKYLDITLIDIEGHKPGKLINCFVVTDEQKQRVAKRERRYSGNKEGRPFYRDHLLPMIDSILSTHTQNK